MILELETENPSPNGNDVETLDNQELGAGVGCLYCYSLTSVVFHYLEIQESSVHAQSY